MIYFEDILLTNFSQSSSIPLTHIKRKIKQRRNCKFPLRKWCTFLCTSYGSYSLPVGLAHGDTSAGLFLPSHLNIYIPCPPPQLIFGVCSTTTKKPLIFFLFRKLPIISLATRFLCRCLCQARGE